MSNSSQSIRSSPSLWIRQTETWPTPSSWKRRIGLTYKYWGSWILQIPTSTASSCRQPNILRLMASGRGECSRSLI